jgi:hypothetical protein
VLLYYQLLQQQCSAFCPNNKCPEARQYEAMVWQQQVTFTVLLNSKFLDQLALLQKIICPLMKHTYYSTKGTSIILLSVYTDINVLCIFGRRTCMFGQLLLPSLEEFVQFLSPVKLRPTHRHSVWAGSVVGHF